MQSAALLAVEPTWINALLAKYGTREIVGAEHAPDILAMLETTKLPDSAIADETPWCSAAVNWALREAGYRGTDSAAARSWLAWGASCERRFGAITVLWRGTPAAATGHVGIYVADTNSQCWLLGGNQNNALSIQGYPWGRVLGHRWPTAELRLALRG